MYMQSGIVESYALGLATVEEVDEFEQLLPHFPELKDALSDFEYHLELFSIDHEIPPPVGTREKIEARLGKCRLSHMRGGGIITSIMAPSLCRQGDFQPYPGAQGLAALVHCGLYLAKIFLILAIYYFLEYRHVQGQIIRMAEPAGRCRGLVPGEIKFFGTILIRR